MKNLNFYLALYLFCCHYYSGVHSRLYRLQCRLQNKLQKYFKKNPISSDNFSRNFEKFPLSLTMYDVEKIMIYYNDIKNNHKSLT